VVRRTGGGIVVDPVGFAVDGKAVVPDLAADGGGGGVSRDARS
jgi:hypothetical protein